MKQKFFALLLTLVLLLPLAASALPAYATGDAPAFYGTSLFLENNIAINFLIKKSDFEAAGFSAPYVTFTFKGETRTQDGIDLEKDGYWYFTFHDVTAKDMNETVTATVSAERNGERVTGHTLTESVVSYCRKALFSYATSNPTLCTMIVDLLNYGAKSQEYFEYETANLANAKLTPSQKDMATFATPAATSCGNARYVVRKGSGIAWRAVSLKLEDSVNLQFYFETDDISGIRIEIKNESDQLVASFTEEDVGWANGYWYVCCDILTPDQMRDKLYVTAGTTLPDNQLGDTELPFVGLGGGLSNTLCYSIESYAVDAQKQYADLDLDALLEAMLKYGDSVSAYVKETNAFKVNSPTLRSQLESVPVASPDNTEEENRNIVLAYYALQGSVPWITRDDFTYVYTGSATKDMAANTIYCGMPYSSAAVGLYKFLDYYDENTGVLNNVWGDALGNSQSSSNPGLGNHCASSIYWAWARISTTISFDQTKNMTPAKGVYPVGDYDIDETKTQFEENYDSSNNPVDGAYNTRSICDDNGATRMYQAYAKLKPGDAVVSYYIVKNGNTYTKRHHTRLVKSVSVKTYSSGSPMPSSSKITFYEQDSTLNNFTLNGQAAQHFSKGVVGTVNPISFYDLYQTGYIPITCQELAHDSIVNPVPVQSAEARLSSQPSAQTTDAIGKKTLSSNYCMAKITLTAVDASGDVAACVSDYKTFNTTQCNLNTLAGRLNKELYKGTYTVYLDVLLSNGETKRVLTHTVVKS